MSQFLWLGVLEWLSWVDLLRDSYKAAIKVSARAVAIWKLNSREVIILFPFLLFFFCVW